MILVYQTLKTDDAFLSKQTQALKSLKDASAAPSFPPSYPRFRGYLDLLDRGSEESRIEVSGLSRLHREGRHQGRYRRNHLHQASCLRPRETASHNMVQQDAE